VGCGDEAIDYRPCAQNNIITSFNTVSTGNVMGVICALSGEEVYYPSIITNNMPSLALDFGLHAE